MYISLPLFVLHDFNVKLLETSWLFVLWRKCHTCSFSLFFSLSLIFILVATSISHFLTAATKFLVVPPTKSVFLVFFSLAVALFLVELRWPVALLSLFLCLSLSLYSKFVDTTINLNVILYRTTPIQKHFLLSVFVFIDSLVVSASQEGAGHTLSRQNNLTSGIRLHEVCVRTGGRTLRHNQIILAFIGYQENVQPFFSVQKTVILRFKIDQTARGIFLVLWHTKVTLA